MVRRGAAAALAAALALGAVPAIAQPDVNPRVAPKHGQRGTTFRVAFTAPKATGLHAGFVRDYSVQFQAKGTGCLDDVYQTVPKAKAGQRILLRFAPGDMGWCPGNGRATIYMSEGQRCDEGDQLCPASPSWTRVIGRARFSVR
jgi:hypothetical protein